VTAMIVLREVIIGGTNFMIVCWPVTAMARMLPALRTMRLARTRVKTSEFVFWIYSFFLIGTIDEFCWPQVVINNMKTLVLQQSSLNDISP
jgi:hypothetical protein